MKKISIVKLFILLWVPSIVSSQSIIQSVHNLSASGSGKIKTMGESEICIFCHTSHINKPISPSWGKNDRGTVYTLYNSSTMQALPGQPDGSSILCLSCHDGTIALGNMKNRTSDITFGGGVTRMPVGKSNLTTDLSDDHPISFIYNSSLDAQIKYPPMLPITLENDKVQCTSCHNPHNNIYTKFLVASNEYSDLCFKCHDINYWFGSSHKSSIATWNGSGTNPWAHIETPYSTVSQNACGNCHNLHNAEGKQRLFKSRFEENNCLDCHNGNVAATAKNIEAQLTKTYNHNVYAYNMIHDPVEPATILTKHVECIDCHNPHASNSITAVAPNVNGFIAGVRGVDQNGTPIDPVHYEYEICYRCHADNPATISSISRQIEQNNIRLEFDIGNPSYHPVVGQGTNIDVPSLIAPLTESSIIYCTDCHASNGVGSPAGPHGSIYPQILKYRYETADNTAESAMVYELCYSCHSRTSILNDESFKEHNKHIRSGLTPCSACHDAHGINNTQGNRTNNSNLINFDLTIVSPDGRFEDQGSFRGSCYLSCHGKTHNPLSY